MEDLDYLHEATRVYSVILSLFVTTGKPMGEDHSRGARIGGQRKVREPIGNGNANLGAYPAESRC